MIVCHCRAVCDRRIRDAVRKGAVSPNAVARACGAGAECGGCRPAVCEIIAEEHAPDRRLVTAGSEQGPAAFAG